MKFKKKSYLHQSLILLLADGYLTLNTRKTEALVHLRQDLWLEAFLKDMKSTIKIPLLQL
jgi:hypothetical protein